MDKLFHNKGLPVPEFYIQSKDGLYYLQEDLGNTLLFDFIAEGRKTGVFCELEKEMLRKTIRKLPEIQVKGAEDLDFSICYPQPEFNERSILWDLNYFKYCFLKATGIDFQENLLEDDFHRFSKILLSQQSNTFMYRDFQSRNVMIKNDEPYFIDFQEGKRTFILRCSLVLWQAKAKYSDELREELLENYLSALAELMPINEKGIQRAIKTFCSISNCTSVGSLWFSWLF